MKILLYSIAASVVLTLAYACGKATSVGSDLFVPDSINLLFEDDFEINAKTVRVDSVVSFDRTAAISSLIVGELEDPVFGSTRAEGFVDLRLGGGGAIPSFEYMQDGFSKKVILDSVVLVLQYNERAFYGDSTAVQNFEVRVLDEEISREDSIFSTFYPSSSEIIGTKSFVPKPNDSLFIIEPGDTATTAVFNQFRMRLDDSWAQQMIDDTSLVSTSDNLLEFAPAIHILSNTSGSSTVGFNFAPLSNGAAPDNYIYVYYTQDTLKRSYRFALTGIKHNYFEHDLSSGEIEDFIGDEVKGDSLLFIQGMAGPVIELDLPVLSNGQLDDFIVNQMELEFFVLEDADIGIYDPITSINIQSYDEDGDLNLIEDAVISFDQNSPAYFGGTLDSETIDGQIVQKYSAIISIHAIRELSKSEPLTRLRITPRNKTLTPKRSIIYGPGHSQYPMKLKVNYSK